MKVVRLVEGTLSPELREDQAPEPKPGRGELLIQVFAAGVIPTELSWSPTTRTKSGERRTGAIPCHEFSGVVAAAGEGATMFPVGQEVFGMNDWYDEGALAEFCLAPSTDVAAKPLSLTHGEAASAPISALTAWQGLLDRAQLRAGERVLIHGGAGGVGNFAIQLARMHGAHVITTASGRNLDFVKELGAHEAIDYRAERFEEIATGMDVVFDAVGGETLERSWGVLKPGGRLVTIASTTEELKDARAKKAFFIVEPDQKQLVEISLLLESGQLRTIVDTVVPLADAPDLYAGKVKLQGRGKSVVEVAK